MNKHEPCPRCGSTERTPWLHAREYPALRSATPHYPMCYRYCRGCCATELMAHGDHRKELRALSDGAEPLSMSEV